MFYIFLRYSSDRILGLLNSKLLTYNLNNSETLTNISKDAVGRLLKRVKSRGSRAPNETDDSYLKKSDPSSKVGFVNDSLFLFCMSGWSALVILARKSILPVVTIFCALRS